MAEPNTERYTEKISVYITPEMKELVKNLPKSYNLSAKLRNHVDMLLREHYGATR